ncbi:MAG: sugar nucleotide-binding protein, partial [Deltaproteobacteria bacterium]|nr:sugar nucleotide-binding protein [Deltaproteobacteria bacterium]
MEKITLPFEQVVVVGGTGQVGHRVLELLLEHEGLAIVATSRAIGGTGAPAGPLATTIAADALRWGARVKWAALDLESETPEVERQLAAMASALARGRRTALVFAAAFTNVDACETDPARCERVNERNTAAVMKWARDGFGARIAFYSTDYVFDGERGFYPETSPRSPVSAYGRSKAFVEEWLERHAPDSLILRTTGVYDYLPGSKNFLMQMLALWGEGKPTRVPSDQLANPVWARQLAKATVELLARGSRGIYNVAGATQLARVDFARAI